jgi:hypothetical protein
MKLKTVILTIGIVGAGFLFTGCSSKGGYTFELKQDVMKCSNHFNRNKIDSSVCELAKDNNLMVVVGIGDASMLTTGAFNNSTAAAIQVAAEATLKREHNYFAIVLPEQISNFKGSMINTPEEFFKKCEIDLGNVFSFNKSPCRIQYVSGSPRNGRMIISTYLEQPNDTLTFNAKEVLEYLHTEKKYQPDTALKYYNVQN